MALLLLFVGKTKEGFIREGIEKYRTLISHFHPVEVREIKGSSRQERQAAVEEEADSILGRLQGGDYVVALDERGGGYDSAGFAAELGRLLGDGRRVNFIVGGPFGLSERVRQRADKVLSLSKLTFTHEMARLILAEQIYRAITITRGKAYHY